ncbi:MAG: hypothetical protein GYA24_25980 [Candidatus Lokiarchaeota archaeon]|nr:hypothetical protein [Candidatus Lokiarchaeota archaeon]
MGFKDRIRKRGTSDTDSPEFNAAFAEAAKEYNKMIKGVEVISYTPGGDDDWRQATPITTDPRDARFLDIEINQQTTPTAADMADETYKNDVTEYFMDVRGMSREQVKEYINSGEALADGTLVPAMFGAKVTQFTRNLARLATTLQSMPACNSEYHALLAHLFDTQGQSIIITAAANGGGPVSFEVDASRHRKNGIVRLVARTAQGGFITAMGFKYHGVNHAQEMMSSGAIAALDGESFSKMHMVFMG